MPDLTLPDTDKDGLCDLPQAKTVVRGDLRVTAANPVEAVGNTVLEANRIVVEDGGRFVGQRGALRSLTLVTLAGDLEVRAGMDLDASDDVVLTARRGAIHLGGDLHLEAADRLIIDARSGDIEIAPAVTPTQGDLTMYGGNRLDVHARNAAGSIDVRGAVLGGKKVSFSNRANVSVAAPHKRIALSDGTRVTTRVDRGGNVDMQATGRVVLAGASIEVAKKLLVQTARTTDRACLSRSTRLVARDLAGRPGWLDFAGVRGETRDDGTTTFDGQLRGVVVPGTCDD